METTFLLGTLSGLLLVAMVYAFWGALRATKRIKDLETQLKQMSESVTRDYEWQQRDTDERWKNHYTYMNDTGRHIADRFKDIERRLDEAFSYTDSRIDKTIDGLCNRMDNNFLKKEENTLIKS